MDDFTRNLASLAHDLGRRVGERWRAASDAAKTREREREILAFLEQRALPYFESAEADVNRHDAAFAHEINRKANLAKLIPYGPSNRQAFKSIPADLAARLPSSPENRQKAFLQNGKWWADNRPAVSERWDDDRRSVE